MRALAAGGQKKRRREGQEGEMPSVEFGKVLMGMKRSCRELLNIVTD